MYYNFTILLYIFVHFYFITNIIYSPHLLVVFSATLRLHLLLQTYPYSRALYVISVRRTKSLLTASFRFHFTMDTLAVQLCASSLPRCTWDFHPLESAHGGQTKWPFLLKRFKFLCSSNFFDSLKTNLYQAFQKVRRNISLAGVVRFELTNDRVRADCLTTWRHPNVYNLLTIITVFDINFIFCTLKL